MYQGLILKINIIGVIHRQLSGFQMWTPPNFPEDAERVELYIMGPQDVKYQLCDLIKEIECPLTNCEAEDSLVLIYAYPFKAQLVFDGLFEKLCGLYPGLIFHPEGVYIEDEVLYFKGAEVSIVNPSDFVF